MTDDVRIQDYLEFARLVTSWADLNADMGSDPLVSDLKRLAVGLEQASLAEAKLTALRSERDSLKTLVEAQTQSLRLSSDSLLEANNRANAAEAERDSLAEQFAVACEGLRDAAAAFRTYAMMHRLKGSEEGCSKAKVNDDRADACERILSTLPETAKAMIEVVEKVEKLKARWDYFDRRDCAADLFVTLSKLRGG